MASVKSVEPENNCFSVNHIIRCRSKLLPLGFSKFVLVLIFAIFLIAEIQKIDLEALFFRILKIPTVKI